MPCGVVFIRIEYRLTLYQHNSVTEIYHMSFDKKTIMHVAHLSNIDLPEDKIGEYTDKLSHVMTFIETLNEVDIEGIEPMTSVLDLELPLRKDEVTEGNIVTDILLNAPEKNDDYFVVPKIIE